MNKRLSKIRQKINKQIEVLCIDKFSFLVSTRDFLTTKDNIGQIQATNPFRAQQKAPTAYGTTVG